MQKLVLRFAAVDDPKMTKKALRSVAGMEGVESVSIIIKDYKITMIGDADPVAITKRLRKFGWAKLLCLGPPRKSIRTLDSASVSKIMKRFVIRFALIDDSKIRRKALMTLAGMEGVESVSINTKDYKITVNGDADPVAITKRLRKLGRAELLSVGPFWPGLPRKLSRHKELIRKRRGLIRKLWIRKRLLPRATTLYRTVPV